MRRARWVPKSPPRGVGLATTLVVITIIVMLGFTVAGVSISHLSVSTRLSNAEVARDRAESLLAVAIDRVIAARETGTDFSGPIELTFGAGEPPGTARLSFDQVQANTWTIPYSTNNISGNVSATGDLGRIVPAYGVHLIGVATCNGVERRREAILLIPKYPHSVASSGTITTNGGLQVAAVDDLSLLASGGLAAVPPDQIQPGDIACNSTNPLQAMHLDGPNVHITGDAKAAGGIDWNTTTVVVDGAIRPNSDKTYLPKLNVTDYDPAGKAGLVSVSGNVNNLRVDYWTKSTGNLYVSGGLHLDQGVLYVDGDLSVNGGISGSGAVFATGKIEVFGGGSMATDDQAAIVSNNGIDIQASAADPAQLKGLMYTEGDLKTDYVTLGGSAVANSPGGGNVVQLDNSEIAYNPTMTDINLNVGANQGGGGGGGSGSGGTTFPTQPPAWTGTPKALSYQSNNGNVNVPVTLTPVMATAPSPSFFYDTATSQYVIPNGQTLAGQMEWQVTINGTPIAGPIPNGSLQSTLRTELESYLASVGESSGTGSEYPNVDQQLFSGYTLPPPLTPPPPKVTDYINNALSLDYGPSVPITNMNTYIASNPPPSTWGTGGGGGGTTYPVEPLLISLNDSSFAELRDRMKILYWGDSW